MPTLHKTSPKQRPSQIRMATSRGPVEAAFSRGSVTYQLQRINCGKKKCRRCAKAASHGPYWYAYYWSKGATRSKYIGKKLPPAVAGDAQAAEPA